MVVLVYVLDTVFFFTSVVKMTYSITNTAYGALMGVVQHSKTEQEYKFQ